MSRINAILALALVACALAVIQSQHRSRTYFVELERLKKEARALDEQWGQLQLEQRTRLGLIAPPHDRVRVETLVSAP